MGLHNQCSRSDVFCRLLTAREAIIFATGTLIGLACYDSGSTNTTSKGQERKTNEKSSNKAQWQFIRASELQWRRYHLIFWAEIQPFPWRTLNTETDHFFCWHKWSSLPLKGRPRTFFFPFFFFLSNTSYTDLRISGLYYKHAAISFKRNRRCRVFLWCDR